MGNTYSSSLTTKGQVTIPKRMREGIKVAAGDTVAFELRPDRGEIVIRKIERKSILALGGIAAKRTKGH